MMRLRSLATARGVIAAASMAALVGCAQKSGDSLQAGQVVGGATKQVTDDVVPVGGFLPRPDLLARGQAGQAYFVYVSPTLQPRSYKSIMLDPVTVWTLSDSQLQSVSAAQRQRLADSFTAHLGKALKTVCPMTTRPGPGVVRLRFALTDALDPHAVVTTIATYAPYVSTAYGAASLVFNGGVGFYAGTASAEAYGIDAVSGDLLWQAVDKRGGTTALVKDTLSSWVDVEHAFEAWANVLADRMKAAGFCQGPH